MFNNLAKQFEKATGTKLPGTGGGQAQAQQHQSHQYPPQQQYPQQQQYPPQQQYPQQQQYPPQQQYPQQQQYPPQQQCPPQQQQYHPQLHQCTHPCGPRRALLVGINYKGQRGELNGCINDVKCMAYLLETKYSYPSSAILTLTDDESDPQRTPTRRNIQQAMQWLIGARGCTEPGDTLFFHYSGHGGQVRDRTGREADGLSETLIPLDAECSGMITDDELHEMLVARVVQGSKLTAVVDACHSGTILDLPLKFDASKGRWEQHASGSPHQSMATGGQGQVICFSGCDDDQTSADQSQLSNGTSTGAMTFALIAAAEDEHDTYKSVIHDVYDTLKGKGDSSTGNEGAKAALAAGAVGAALVAGLSVLGSGNTRQLTYKIQKFQRKFNQMMGGHRATAGSNNQYSSAMQMYMGFMGGGMHAGGESAPRFTQEPQISTNFQLDLNSRFSL